MKEWADIIFRGIKILFEMGLHREFHYIAYISGGRRLCLTGQGPDVCRW